MLAAAPPIIDPSDPVVIVELKRQLQFAHLKIQLLEERLRLQRIQKYGPASEKLNNANGVAGRRARRQQSGSCRRKRARTAASNSAVATQAQAATSWTADITLESGAGRTGN